MRKRRGRRPQRDKTLLMAALEDAGLSMAELARLAKTSPQQIERLVKSQRKLSKEWAIRLAPHVKKSPAELMFGSDKVEVVGYVGAGSEVIPIDDHDLGAGLEEIDRPAGVGGTVVALIVRGDSMFPRYKEGEYLLHGDRQPPDGLVGRECVVWLPDGRVLVKELLRGSNGLYSLFSHNAPIIENIAVESASPVIARVNKASK